MENMNHLMLGLDNNQFLSHLACNPHPLSDLEKELIRRLEKAHQFGKDEKKKLSTFEL